MMMEGAFTNALQQADGAQPATWRSAALVLHGMGAEDRQWVLSRLTPEQREAMQAMVDELGALAFPSDPVLVREAMARPAEPAPIVHQKDDDDAALIRLIAQASAARIVVLLVDEPAGVVDRLLRLHAWPWADEVRSSWCAALGNDMLQQSMGEDAGTSASPATWTRFDRQMLRALRQRLQQSAVGDRTLPATGAATTRLPRRAWESLVARVARSAHPLLGRGRPDRQPKPRAHP